MVLQGRLSRKKVDKILNSLKVDQGRFACVLTDANIPPTPTETSTWIILDPLALITCNVILITVGICWDLLGSVPGARPAGSAGSVRVGEGYRGASRPREFRSI